MMRPAVEGKSREGMGRAETAGQTWEMRGRVSR